MKYSVIICTYNQAAFLRLVLQFLQNQTVSGGEVELLVIDNNSKDDTRFVCEALLPLMPFPSRYVFEGRQGLSVARNRGVKEASGEVLIFTDDDANLPPSWLQKYVDAYQKYNADCVYGRIAVDWSREAPKWYSDYFSAMFVVLDYGNNPLRIRDVNHEFYGKNFSVRKSALLSLGGFDEKLGRIGSRLFLGEETRIYKGLVNGGYEVVYEPSLCVGHMLKDYEYTEDHCLKHVRDSTISEYYMMAAADGRKIYGRPVHALRRALKFLWLAVRVFGESFNSSGYAFRFYAKTRLSKAALLIRLWLANGSSDIS